MMNISAIDRAMLVCCIQTISFCQEAFQSAFCTWLAQAAIRCAKPDILQRQQTGALIMEYPVIFRFDSHVCPVVRQLEDRTGCQYCRGIGRIQRKEKYA